MVDEKNFLAIIYLELLGIELPSQPQIDLMEAIVSCKKDLSPDAWLKGSRLRYG